jgi:DNA-binding MarR family transcriptional regulator
MARIMDVLRNHLDMITGHPVALDAARSVAAHLPIFLGSRYDFFRCRLFERDRLLAVWKGATRPGVGELRIHFERMGGDLGEEPVLVLPKLEPYERQRLLDWGIPFLVPGSQTYIPQVMVDLRESWRRSSRYPDNRSGTLSPPAQLMLLHHLYFGSDGFDSLSDWGKRLGYSPMSMSRAQAELADRDLGESHRHGRRLRIHFPDSRSELWRKAQSALFNPVQQSFSAALSEKECVPLALAGLSALAHYAGIGPGRIATYSLGRNEFRRLQKADRMELHPTADEGDILLEKWKYPPTLLSGSESITDRLSVCLSLRDDPDERVQAAIREVEESMAW